VNENGKIIGLLERIANTQDQVLDEVKQIRQTVANWAQVTMDHERRLQVLEKKLGAA
jgi:hypothetical protein